MQFKAVGLLKLVTAAAAQLPRCWALSSVASDILTARELTPNISGKKSHAGLG